VLAALLSLYIFPLYIKVFLIERERVDHRDGPYGSSANLILSMLDPLVAGFTQTGAQLIDPNYVANPAMNYYFLVVSCLVLVPVAVFVTAKIVEPRLGTYTGEKIAMEKVTADEKRGLKWAAISLGTSFKLWICRENTKILYGCGRPFI
jgi:p-aminobenzoyl-glutamate transporter AbgT